MPDDVVIDGRPAAVTPFSDEAEAHAAIRALFIDATDISRRCRIDKERGYCRDLIGEFALMALMALDDYRGVNRDPLGYKQLREWVERELNGTAE